MQRVHVLTLPLTDDIASLVMLCRENGLYVHVTEEGGQQKLWVENESSRETFLQLHEKWTSGLLVTPKAEQPSVLHDISPSLFLLRALQLPLTSLIILLGVVGACIASYSPYDGLAYLTFEIFFIENDGVYSASEKFYSIREGEIWRLLTPVFIHSGAVHIIFNALWIWMLGQKLESLLGWKWYFLVFAFIGVVSNIAQHLMSGTPLFGGLSGVIYGFLGFLAVRQYLSGGREYYLPPSLFGLMLIFLALGYAGVMDMFVEGSVANTGHSAGLISGALVGLLSLKLLLPSEVSSHTGVKITERGLK